VQIIFMLRTVLGWEGHRIAAELEARGVASVTGQTVYRIFERLGLPIQVYALKGRSEGIADRRYGKKRPNQQWHIGLKHAALSDGTKVFICIIIDDYSRYAVAAMVGTAATSEWVTQVTQAALRRAGQPGEMVSDNGREFVSVWEESRTTFGRLLADLGVKHLTCSPTGCTPAWGGRRRSRVMRGGPGRCGVWRGCRAWSRWRRTRAGAFRSVSLPWKSRRRQRPVSWLRRGTIRPWRPGSGRDSRVLRRSGRRGDGPRAALHYQTAVLVSSGRRKGRRGVWFVSARPELGGLGRSVRVPASGIRFGSRFRLVEPGWGPRCSPTL